MKTLFSNNKSFLLPYLLFFAVSIFAILTTEQKNLHLFINSYYSGFFDSFFYYITYLGDGIFPFILSIVLLFFSFKSCALMAGSNLLASGITLSLKHLFFSSCYRPKKIFEEIGELRYVEGVENWSYYSFPSGHTTTAFATFFTLSVLTDKPALKLLFFIIAVLTSFSRVYLSQHFYEDVIAGSVCGILAVIVAFRMMDIIPEKALNRSLINK